VSDIDISFDFHPYVPSEKSRAASIERKIQSLEAKIKTNPSREKKYQQDIESLRDKLDEPINKNGLWLENYVIAKRYSDGYLGIDQRYEIGAGVIFSFYGGSLTRKGQDNMDEINRKPTYKMMGQDLLRCLTSCAPIHNVLQLTESDIVTLSDTRSRYMVSNYKQYSRLRASLLLGVYYELEETTITGTIPFNGKDTLITYGFASTNRLRAEIRPGFVWKPKDKYRLKFHPYIKFPLDRLNHVVTADGARDERLDYFVDLHASLDISVDKNFSISLAYRYLYDHAPNRIFFQQADGSQVLLVGEQRRSSFEVGLNFNF
ncbi:MAG TPA: hypothetical protein VFX48_08930, partial [Saprospiraceae bacterium]|nr:hypothetical protein [Saprospiraceae bacterium]